MKRYREDGQGIQYSKRKVGVALSRHDFVANGCHSVLLFILIVLVTRVSAHFHYLQL